MTCGVPNLLEDRCGLAVNHGGYHLHEGQDAACRWGAAQLGFFAPGDAARQGVVTERVVMVCGGRDYVPTKDDLAKCFDLGSLVAEKLNEVCGED